MNRHRFLFATAVLASLVHAPLVAADVTSSLLPAATGTLALSPTSGGCQIAPVGDQIQSSYFRTTALNRVFRRGFLEFAIPSFDGTLVSATLELTEGRGQTTFPQPPDRHELGYYDADLVVDTGDCETPASPLAEFETDVNTFPASFSFDVTALIDAYKGRNLGLRIKLAVDPEYSDLGSLGTGIQGNSMGYPARIVLVRSDATDIPDADQDGVADDDDNCTLVPNPGQCDSDGDNVGNHCDGDLSNDGTTNAQDGVILRNLLGAGTPGPLFNIGDLNCNGFVNAQDLTLFRPMLGKPPGPSGLAP